MRMSRFSLLEQLEFDVFPFFFQVLVLHDRGKSPRGKLHQLLHIIGIVHLHCITQQKRPSIPPFTHCNPTCKRTISPSTRFLRAACEAYALSISETCR